MHRFTLLAATLVLGACHRVNREEQSRHDARDVAMVLAAQHAWPSPVPLVPQALTPGALPDQVCTFADPAHAAGRPILGLSGSRAGLRVGGQLVTFAADPGSARLPRGTHSRYSGRQFSLQFTPLPTLATPTPARFADASRQPVTATISDEHERTVFESVGDLTCVG